jgi:hypothetical protein
MAIGNIYHQYWWMFIISIPLIQLSQKRFLKPTEFDRWGFSVLISAMSLCLLLKRMIGM